MPPIGAEGIGAKRVGVIGAGMVGVCAASWLQRDGHSVFLIDPDEPGRRRLLRQCRMLQRLVGDAGRDARRRAERAAAGCSTRSGRWRCAGAICRRSLPWLLRFIRAGTPEKVRAAARALAPAGRADVSSAAAAGQRDAGAEDLVHRVGHLYVYRSAEAWRRTARLGSAARQRGRGRRIRRRRIAPARARSVARLCARPAGARERPYLEPARTGRASRRALRAARAARSCGRGRTAFASKAAG